MTTGLRMILFNHRPRQCWKFEQTILFCLFVASCFVVLCCLIHNMYNLFPLQEAGVKSRRHMKLMLRWLRERQQVRINCITHHNTDTARPAGAVPGVAGSTSASSSGDLERTVVTSPDQAADLAIKSVGHLPPLTKKKGHSRQKAHAPGREFVYSLVQRYVPKNETVNQ